MFRLFLAVMGGVFLLGNISSWAADINHLRGQRYCEILLGFKIKPATASSSGFFIKPMKVYNTIGLNHCPENLWETINVNKIKETTGASNVKLNGPRIWTIDGIKSSTLVNPTVVSFNKLQMREAGILDLPLYYFLKKLSAYHPLVVERNTTWVYQSGKRVYELIDPKKNKYIMQSYSLEKIPQTEASLVQLGSTLKLPKNWYFRSRVLDREYNLTPLNRKAVVVQDEFLNTYQKEV